MTDAGLATRQLPTLNALFIAAWRRHGGNEVMDDGMEVVSYHTLMRRVTALSCFIDECAGPGRGPVLLYLPSGLWAVRCLMAALLSGRAALPIEAVAEARRGPIGHAGRRFLEPDRPHLDLLEEKPSLLITLGPLARIAGPMLAQAALSDCPVLYANDITRMMDIGHQERIRARLQKSWQDAAAAIDPDSPAMFTESRPEEGGEVTLEASTHAALVEDVAERLDCLGTPPPRRFLSMTSTSKLTTWTASILPCLAVGGRTSFIRFFHPQHVLDVLHGHRIEHLLMSPPQYGVLAGLIGGNRPEWPVQYWTDAAPPAGLAREFEAASGAPLRWIDEARG